MEEKPKHRRKRYSIDDKATVLAVVDSNGGNVKKTAKMLGLPQQTVDAWTNGKDISEEAIAKVPAKRKELSLAIEDVIYSLLEQMPMAATKAPLRDISLTAAIMIDKVQNLRGKPSNITGSVQITDDAKRKQAEQALKQFMDEAEARGAKLERPVAIAFLAKQDPEIAEYLN